MSNIDVVQNSLPPNTFEITLENYLRNVEYLNHLYILTKLLTEVLDSLDLNLNRSLQVDIHFSGALRL